MPRRAESILGNRTRLEGFKWSRRVLPTDLLNRSRKDGHRASSYMGGRENSEEVFTRCEWEVGKDPSGVTEDKVPIFRLYRGKTGR